MSTDTESVTVWSATKATRGDPGTYETKRETLVALAAEHGARFEEYEQGDEDDRYRYGVMIADGTIEDAPRLAASFASVATRIGGYLTMNVYPHSGEFGPESRRTLTAVRVQVGLSGPIEAAPWSAS